ncbi:hypothetical protein AiwAL_03260 [Acidiphilium sp. AL]|uniref:hypothetical protein n=1 Tax=Acidiphilium sp. AL TaxID=2871704 RepID=UPI0021CB5B59|nr:hypothetical protein [Acidiphilium sp. AL]MCU4159121.1 hypothetical protein [Acidiphilium sp. AL]
MEMSAGFSPNPRSEPSTGQETVIASRRQPARQSIVARPDRHRERSEAIHTSRHCEVAQRSKQSTGRPNPHAAWYQAPLFEKKRPKNVC